MEETMGNRVYVFDTATLRGTKDRMLFFAGAGEPLEVTIQSCLIDTGQEKILVDTGIAAPDAPYLKGFGFQQMPEQTLTARLAALDCQPADISTVVNTHLHIDHSGNNRLFEHADIYVHLEELKFAYVPGYQQRIYNRSDFDHHLHYLPVRDDLEIARGVHLLQTPGHTPGHQSVLVETSEGNILITGDACRLQEHWDGIGDTIMYDSERYYRSQERMHSLHADVVILGHDGEAFKLYKKQYGA
jgi:glyoxylase-like metal-dependent hydrolase (beta-lactamase superfamily II)